nr:antitoxin VbhA family protein [uncultured Acidocella sp.]
MGILMPERLQINQAERDRRQAAVDYARGSNRLEGLVVSPAAEDIFARYVAGELEADALMQEIQKLHGHKGR